MQLRKLKVSERKKREKKLLEKRKQARELEKKRKRGGMVLRGGMVKHQNLNVDFRVKKVLLTNALRVLGTTMMTWT